VPDSPDHDDDLTQIAGIGAKIAQRLSEAGIRTYAELAAHSADDIMALLPGGGLPLARLEGWRDQARELAAADEVPAGLVPGDLPTAHSNGQYYESFVVRVLRNEDGSVRRTTVQHVGSGEERQWPGLARDALAEFIETKASAAASPPMEPAPPTPALAPPAPVGREPDGARGVPFTSSATLSLEHATLRAAEPFTMTMVLELGGTARPAGRLAYSAVIVAKPLGGGPKLTVAQPSGLVPTATPTISIDAPGLPAGAFRLDGAVSLFEPGGDRQMSLAAIAEGLLVQVSPG
jgi:hypothetical protein